MSQYQKYDYATKFKKIPILLLLTVISINCIGFVVLWSAADGNLYPWAYKQIIHFAIFFPISILIAITDIRFFYNISYLLYFIILILLITVEVAGVTAMGGKRWIDIGFVRLQPSELAKIALILMMAKYFHKLKATEINKIPRIMLASIMIMLPVALIIKQPDLGTGLLSLFAAGIVFFNAGIYKKYFVFAGGFTLLSFPVAWHFMYEYQRQRLLIFLDPQLDPLGSGYNIIQSKIAIGSGGLFGKGLLFGTQSHLDFLPEHQTDFIFASMAEELGFIGGVVLLILYSLLIIISLAISYNCRTMFGKLMVTGITAIFFSHVFINIAMVMGLVPAVGVPLPFISYGGAIMASMLIGFGLIMNAHIHQYSNI